MTVHLDAALPANQDDPEPASPCDDPPERSQSDPVAFAGLHVDVALSASIADRVDSSGVAWLIEHSRKTGQELALQGELRVRIVGDAEMAAMHERHLGDPSTTDVMTFDLSEGAAVRNGTLDVDVLACIDEADRRAKDLGHPVERELLLYVVHAILHCLGHDDHDEASYARMHAREDEILERIGVGRTFAVELRDRSASS